MLTYVARAGEREGEGGGVKFSASAPMREFLSNCPKDKLWEGGTDCFISVPRLLAWINWWEKHPISKQQFGTE